MNYHDKLGILFFCVLHCIPHGFFITISELRMSYTEKLPKSYNILMLIRTPQNLSNSIALTTFSTITCTISETI